jgi:FkbM family methyltransferase
MDQYSKAPNAIGPATWTSVIDEELQLFETATGRWWLPEAPGDVVADAMKRGRVFDAPLISEAKRHIRPGTVVLDVGANFGQMTVLFAKLVGPHGRVHAFEAEPFVGHILQKNVEVNGVGEVVTIHRGAVWHTAGVELVFPKPDLKKYGSYGSYGIVPSATEGRRVRSLTVDELGIQGISFMKVDVQGSDLFALQGARSTIMRERMPILFEFERPPLCEDFDTSFSDYADFVADIGYSFVRRIHLDSDNFLICPRQGIRSDWRSRMISTAVPYRHTANSGVRAVRALLSRHPVAEHHIKKGKKLFKRLLPPRPGGERGQD